MVRRVVVAGHSQAVMSARAAAVSTVGGAFGDLWVALAAKVDRAISPKVRPQKILLIRIKYTWNGRKLG